ncbi:receptor-like cytosolic serine/threonine-protein kinase RBK2 [Neltuma alba]|uniref:receptor-like cytosolic serine/threonine-protein kinase RBK2 n=1 Tax=Neltuma alba TaxID=207710 RepID=UPI0010A3C89A|nr:receptor-like cytosolic serine/threonine-protein kinase RBK2 [Prosopis alba]
MDSVNQTKVVPADDAPLVKHKKRSSLFRSSTSAQDLRHFELEKEKEDVSSPRGVLEACIRDFDSCLQSSEMENGCSRSKAQISWSKYFKNLKKRSMKRLASFPPLGVPTIPKGKSKSSGEDPVLTNVYNFRSSLVNFTLSELRNSTNNFSNENLIGSGGYSEVYWGRLQDGSLVAIKSLTKGTPDERTASFLSELGIIAHVDHPNIAKLIGCDVGGMHLVFQLSRLGSLGSLLHGPSKNKLDWSKRYKIALGVANGLLYLHESCHRRIIHRDIKSDNILLTESFEPQICDFGLAKWLPRQCTHHNVSKFEGTFGYLAPEYFMHGMVDEKTDVYSFGVILLELITGRPAVDQNQLSVVLWAKPLVEDNNIKDLVDPCLHNNFDREQMDRVILTASLCIEHSPVLRPCMSQQAAILLRDDDFVRQPTNASRRRSFLRTYSQELLDAQEYNSTKYLNDLNQHKKIALGS